MGYRTIIISKPCKISIQNHNFLYSPVNEESISVPISDISIIVLETNRITITSALLSKLGKQNIILFSVDSSHVPNGIFIPFHQHSRFTLISHLQNEWTVPFKKKLWQQIIKQKIFNHAMVLKYFSKNEHRELILFSKSVKSGDSSHVEGYSAKAYWSYLFDNFNRRDINDWRNYALNYGYSIIRGAIARSLSASGFIPAFGLYHHNQLNAFNLVDDLIEPYRCFIEKRVSQIFINNSILIHTSTLSKEYRTQLVEILQEKVIINGFETDMLNSIDIMISSLVNATKIKTARIYLPSLKVENQDGK